jgi:diguanylate cyclase (GGDEF)-like protein
MAEEQRNAHPEPAGVNRNDATKTTSPPGGYARRLDEAPLRAKVMILVLAAAVFGALVGIAEAQLGHRFWPLMLGLTVVSVGLIVASQHWVALPVDRLVRRLERITKTRASNLLKELPTSRPDEVGRIALAFHTVAADSLRCNNEARRLRRTLHSNIEKATLNATRRLREIAMRDPLTNLGNRRFLDEQLPALVEATTDTGTELMCIMIDLDDFKAINDTLGHAVGDELLRLVGELISGAARQQDMAVRLGGDEFVLFLPGADRNRAAALIDRVRMIFRQQNRTMHPAGPHADLSAGVAALLADRLTDGEALIERADQNLYRAKHAGKGTTFVGSAAA